MPDGVIQSNTFTQEPFTGVVAESSFPAHAIFHAVVPDKKW